jgi:hypothetical protein
MTKPPQSSVWLRFRSLGAPLRLGLLTDSDGIPEWLARVVERLGMIPEVEISSLFQIPPGVSPMRPAPWLFRRLEVLSRRSAPDGFSPARTPSGLQTQVLAPPVGGLLANADRTLLAECGLDVLLCATSIPLTGPCTGLARVGVWSFFFGEPEFAGFRPHYWREVYESLSVSRLLLTAHRDRFECRELLAECVTATDPSLLFTRNQLAPLAAASELFCRQLVQSATSQPISACAEISPNASPPRWPSVMETASFAIGKLARSARLNFAMRDRVLEWFVAIRSAPPGIALENPAAGMPFRAISTPPGHYYADPFLVEHDSKHWLFVEDWIESEGRACLTCMEVREDGITGEPVEILRRDYHLSYPHVFLHRGDYFLIPETAEAGNVQLFRARRFPFEWEPEAILLENAALVDTTPFHHNGVWYFFTSTGEQPEESYLFSADRLDGRWQYHPNNPISSDIREVRGAGAISSRTGDIIRPVQDCSKGYGYAVNLKRIQRLSEREYEERSVGTMSPTWAPGLLRTHTLNFDSRYQVVDGLRAVPAARHSLQPEGGFRTSRIQSREPAGSEEQPS